MEDDETDLGGLYLESGNVRDQEDRPGIGHNGGPPLDDYDGMDLKDIMKEGRKRLFKSLLRAVDGGYATPAQENTLRQMLKDNGMVMGDPDEGATSGDSKQPKAPLPTFERPDYDRP